MFKFTKLKPESFAIDVSDLSLKVAQLRKKGKFFTLASWGETVVKSGVIVDGEIKDKKEFVSAIKTAISSISGKKIKTNNVVVSLPEKEAFLQVIRMPKMEEKDLAAAVPFEAENYIPFALSEVYLDFQILPTHGHNKDHYDILIVAIPRRIADSYVECFKEAKLRVLAFEIESQAIARALIKGGISPHPVLLIDFGRSRASLLIYSDYSLMFTSSLSVSSDEITREIAKNLNISHSSAEKLKIKYGISVSKGEKCTTSEEKKVFNSIEPIVSCFVAEIKKYVAYFESHAPEKNDPKIEKIILSGRGTNLKNFLEYISSKTKVPVEFGNPWVNILPSPLKEVPDLSFKESLGYTTVLGLALRAVKKDYL